LIGRIRIFPIRLRPASAIHRLRRPHELGYIGTDREYRLFAIVSFVLDNDSKRN
jgi:hypothetical protein